MKKRGAAIAFNGQAAHRPGDGKSGAGTLLEIDMTVTKRREERHQQVTETCTVDVAERDRAIKPEHRLHAPVEGAPHPCFPGERFDDKLEAELVRRDLRLLPDLDRRH